MSNQLSNAREVMRHGRPLNENRFTLGLVSELASNRESLVAVYREGLHRRAQVVPDRLTFDLLRSRTVFGSIKRLEFYAMPLGSKPYDPALL